MRYSGISNRHCTHMRTARNGLRQFYSLLTHSNIFTCAQLYIYYIKNKYIHLYGYGNECRIQCTYIIIQYGQCLMCMRSGLCILRHSCDSYVNSALVGKLKQTRKRRWKHMNISWCSPFFFLASTSSSLVFAVPFRQHFVTYNSCWPHGKVQYVAVFGVFCVFVSNAPLLGNIWFE